MQGVGSSPHLSFHLDDFILKITVLEKVIEKAVALNEKLTENRISIIKLIIENPYISKSELSKHVGISENSISRNIEAMRDNTFAVSVLNRGGFWEIIE